MSKIVKALIVAACLILLGTVICGIGFFCGGWDALTENYGPNAVENSQSWSESVKKLEISTVSDDVVLLPSEDGRCRVDWKDTRYGYYEVSLERGTLEITYHDTEQKIRFDFDDETRTVAVYLPEGTYERLLLTTVSGNAASSGFSFEETEITTVSGEVGLGDGEFGETKIRTTSGDVVLDGCDTSTTEIKTTSGDVGLGHGDFGEAKIATVSGDVVLDGFDAEDTRIETISGSIMGTVTTPRVFTVRGAGGEVGCPAPVDGAEGSFEAKTTSGSIKIAYQ